MIDNYADHSSNERTFLAWVRTVIAIVGFGLAAARLGRDVAPLWSELLMLAAGALVILLAFLRMQHIRRKLASAETADDNALSADAFLLALIAALFGLIAAFGIHVSAS
ncbi:YidH family protein [Microbulbifer sp. S227A]|uniref:YidH family protein n=1 Tax=Microbulbifer sp. S227A TaxID=3415131 RepID=UPI003C7E60DE